MKFFETKHEQNSAKITTLVILILSLLLFIVGPQYMDPPIEYGVAINFGEPSMVNTLNVPDMPTKSEEIIEEKEEDLSPDNEALTDAIEEQQPEEEDVEEQIDEAQVEQAETEEEQAEAERAAEELLAEQEAESERLKAEKEAKEKAEAEKLAIEKAKAEKEAKEKADREAKAKAEKEAREKAEREAKAKAAREAKERADREARAKAAKAEADRKAAAAPAANANKSGGSDVVGFAVIEEAPIYPGCEGLNNEARKQCMSTKVTQFVTSRFDKEIASTLGFTGTQRIRLNFKIDKTGKVVAIRANAADPKLKEEAERIAKLLPKLKPGIQQGKPVIVPYAVTVRFQAKE